MKPHKHAELIRAWANGAEIERYDSGRWLESKTPIWSEKSKYRIKPEPKSDMRIMYVAYKGKIIKEGKRSAKLSKDFTKLILIFDGETGKLKSTEILK